MATTTVGTISYDVKLNLGSLKRDIAQAEKTLNNSFDKVSNSQSTLDKSINSTNKSLISSRTAMIALASAATAAAVAIGTNLNNAIGRSDTLANFPRVLVAMGESANDAQAATTKLAERLQGLPTSLQEGTQAVQGFIAAGLPVSVATEGFLALNNAFLAGGASAQAANQSMVQLQQALSRGRIEGQEWNSIVANTPTFLKAMTLETGKTRDELRELYQTSPEKLIQDMIRLNTEGGGGLQSLDTQARALTDGIGTSFNNMNLAIQRSITQVIDSIGRDNITNAINSIGAGFESAGSAIGTFINVTRPIAPIAGGVAVGLGAMAVATGAVTLSIRTATFAVGAFRTALTLLSRHPIIGTLTLIATAALGVATAMGIMNREVKETEPPAIEVGDALEGWTPAINNASKEAAKMAKQIAKIDKQIREANEDYRYRLAELVADKNKNIATLQDTLRAEKTAYDNAFAERLAGFNKTQFEEEKSHKQKVKELQNQINFLSKYNTAANKQQVVQLKFALAQENAEYKKSTELRQGEFDAQTKSAFEEYEKRRKENQKKLDEELALLEKHRADVLSVRGVMLRDEIEQLKHSRDERIKALQEQRRELLSTGDTATSVASKMSTAFDGVIAKLSGVVGQSSSLAGNLLQAANNASTLQNTAGSSTFQNAMKNLQGANIANLLQAGNQKTITVTGSGSNQVIRVESKADGGFTGRGGKYEPAALVHKGEYVLPQEMVDQDKGLPKAGIGGTINVTVNMSGVMASGKSDMRQIANQMAKLINETVMAKTGKTAIVGV